jgi:hypothetical protein
MAISASQILEFEEATAFERYAIDASIPPHADALNTASMDLRQAPVRAPIQVGFSDDLSFGSVSTAVGRLRPLVFGAAFKVVDLLFELALDVGGNSPANGWRWRIDEKVAKANSEAGDVPPLTDNFPEAWRRICALYVRWEEVRHSLVHRTARVDSTTGELVGQDRSGNPLAPVPAADQEIFARLAVEASHAVITGQLSGRERRRLAWRLNQLSVHHGLPDVADAATPGTAISVVANLEGLPDGRWRVDAGTGHG